MKYPETLTHSFADQTTAIMRALVYNDSNEVLLAKRAAHCRNGGKWEYPGGKVEVQAGETAVEAILRENPQETGVRIKLVDPYDYFPYVHTFWEKDEIHSNLTLFCMAQALNETIVPQEEEVRAALWVPEHQVPNFDLTPASKAALLHFSSFAIEASALAA